MSLAAAIIIYSLWRAQGFVGWRITLTIHFNQSKSLWMKKSIVNQKCVLRKWFWFQENWFQGPAAEIDSSLVPGNWFWFQDSWFWPGIDFDSSFLICVWIRTSFLFFFGRDLFLKILSFFYQIWVLSTFLFFSFKLFF